MKTYELKKISAASVFRLFGGMFLIVGLVFGLFFGLTGSQFLPNDSPLQAIAAKGIIAGLIVGVVYGLVVGLLYLIMASVYNLFAMILGGIKVSLEEWPE